MWGYFDRQEYALSHAGQFLLNHLCRSIVIVVVVLLAEEDAVALAANRGADVPRRVRFLRIKEEPALVGRPSHDGTRLDEVSSEVLCLVDDCLR